ncbi:dITP/XTP pyrophosphatase [compost metagenome]
MADDSGLSVEALGGRPGVRSARYAGPNATDADRNAKLLGELKDVPDAERGACFHCALVLAWPGDGELTVEGVVSGRILHEPRGEHGFGYDPVFYVPSLDKSFAELTTEEKNRYSHRAKAAELLVEALQHATAGR